MAGLFKFRQLQETGATKRQAHLQRNSQRLHILLQGFFQLQRIQLGNIVFTEHKLRPSSGTLDVLGEEVPGILGERKWNRIGHDA